MIVSIARVCNRVLDALIKKSPPTEPLSTLLIATQSSNGWDIVLISRNSSSQAIPQEASEDASPIASTSAAVRAKALLKKMTSRGDNKWDKDSRDPNLRLSPYMENVKRKFMSWLLEGKDQEAVHNFQSLMREAVTMRKDQGIIKMYQVRLLLLAEGREHPYLIYMIPTHDPNPPSCSRTDKCSTSSIARSSSSTTWK